MPRRWIWIALLLAVAAYGWQHTAEQRRSAHEIVAVNRSGRPLEEIRIRVGGRRFDVAGLRHGASAKLKLFCERDDTFDVEWRTPGADQERHWSGGSFHHGPVRMRHRFEFVAGDGIVWRTERIPAASAKAKVKRAKSGRGAARG